MLITEERIAYIERDLKNIRERRQNLGAEIYWLDRRRKTDKEVLRKLREEKEKEHHSDGNRCSARCKSR